MDNWKIVNSNENEFDLHENKPVRGTHFHMNGFALRLFDTEAKGTRKYKPITTVQCVLPRGGGEGGILLYFL